MKNSTKAIIAKSKPRGGANLSMVESDIRLACAPGLTLEQQRQFIANACARLIDMLDRSDSGRYIAEGANLRETIPV